MQTSEDRILTTHVGSLPRVGPLADLLVARARGESVDERTLRSAVADAMDCVVARQLEAGIDIGNDGEMPRESFVSYLSERVRGFGRGPGPERPLPLDAQAFPIWFANTELSARRRVNAGTDCGFGTLAGDCFTAEDVVWAKLGALVEGARIASTHLFNEH